MRFALALSSLLVFVNHAFGTLILFSDPSGLAAEVQFTALNATTLEIRIKNTSTGVPNGFAESDQLLTGVSFDFGQIGVNVGDPAITGGSVRIGPTSASVNFSTGAYGANTDVSGEYGYGNNDGTGAQTNFVSGNSAQATPFGGANLDGPANMDGPQGGLVASPALVTLNGLGAIQNEIIATITLDTPLTNFLFLNNGVTVEFGSDAAFLTGTPEPASLLLLASASLILRRRRIK